MFDKWRCVLSCCLELIKDKKEWDVKEGKEVMCCGC